MRELFPIRGPDDGYAGKCRRFLNRYCHPIQVGTGVLFGTIGIGLTAAGVMYADGMNFAFQTIANSPQYASQPADMNATMDYVRESYKGSMSNAIEAGWKQLPFSYCVGHYVGGRVRKKISSVFGRR